MRTIVYPGAAVLAALVLLGCATGQPLMISYLDDLGWENTASFQCYLSSGLRLQRLPDDSAAAVSFDRRGAARVRNARWTIDLPASLEGRILSYHERDQYLYVAFEEGDAVLPFGRDKDGRFSLMITVDSKYQNGAEFVEYEGVRYKPEYFGKAPYLNVVINRTQNDLRRQMQGLQVRAASEAEEAAARAGEKFINTLPENAVIAVLGIAGDAETAVFVMDELEYQLVDANKFKIVDRKSLEVIRSEQNFQASGNVGDESAVSIGNMLGAGIVITGDISGSGNNRRLNLKALDVQTGEIVVTAREPL
ncbi:MAG: penicillin-binding protein activator LpoB [Treponema sp.]|jgi:TolB-like protein|nr:penicillin-binding protein activator LpoB [Treponema sp.]